MLFAGLSLLLVLKHTVTLFLSLQYRGLWVLVYLWVPAGKCLLVGTSEYGCSMCLSSNKQQKNQQTACMSQAYPDVPISGYLKGLLYILVGYFCHLLGHLLLVLVFVSNCYQVGPTQGIRLVFLPSCFFRSQCETGTRTQNKKCPTTCSQRFSIVLSKHVLT